jgi:hypothetical protein
MAPPKLQELLDSAKAPENQKRAVLGLAAAATAVAGITLAYKKLTAPPKSGRFAGKRGELKEDEYLAAIVGAGPSGSSCGYYLAQQGHKVALLDKARFPRGEWWRGRKEGQASRVSALFSLATISTRPLQPPPPPHAN